jgi:Transposase DDE domain
MIDTNTFLTTLYVVVDDFCKNMLPPEPETQPSPSLTRSEVVTLALFGQWNHFQSERDFYRYAKKHLVTAFPKLPDRSQWNRLLRHHLSALNAFFLAGVEKMRAQTCLFEALDSSAVATRDAKRRGVGWLPGIADIGWSNRMGWYEGCHLLLSVNPQGIITGFGMGAASSHDVRMAETFFAVRQTPHPQLPSVGKVGCGVYVTDKGFAGRTNQQRWREIYNAEVIAPPQRNSKTPWSKPWRRWLAGIRQIVETVNDKLHHTFRLQRERPHDWSGLQARLTAKVALHNFCIWFNQQLGRPNLAFADLIDW